jgi:hypothetical protein
MDTSAVDLTWMSECLLAEYWWRLVAHPSAFGLAWAYSLLAAELALG